MKHSAYILVLVALLGATSCKDNAFFKTESPSAMDVTVFTSPTQTEQVIAGVYALFAEQNSYRSRLGGPWVAMNTDIENYSTSSSSALPDYATYALTSEGDSNGDLIAVKKHPWAYLTMAIERVNICIDGMEEFSDLTNKHFQYLYGEALALRAFLYLEMIKLWGDVPAQFHAMDVNDEMSIYPSKVDRNIIFEQLRGDLRKAAEMMPPSNECPGVAIHTVERMNRQFAWGLLARMDLMYAGKALRPYQMVPGSGYHVDFNVDANKRIELLNEVIEACEAVMDIDGVNIGGKLKANYEDVFRAICGSIHTYDATETLWEIPFADNIRGQWLNRMGAYTDKTAFGHLIHTTGSSKSNGKVVIPPFFAYEFDAKDTRKWVTVNPYKWTYDAKNNQKIDSALSTTESILYQIPQDANKFTLGKYRFEWITFDMQGDDDGINIPIMRYSDILLMYAEAAIGSVCEVTPTRALKYDPATIFNTVRERAGLPAIALTMENIQKERAFEFCGEQIRKYDLMRWGIFAKTLKEAQDKYYYFTKMRTDTTIIDFSGTPYEGRINDKMYVKFERNDDFASDNSKTFRITDIYGLAYDEMGTPEGWDDTNHSGWRRAEIYIGGSEGSKAPVIEVGDGAGQMCVYRPSMEDKLEARQYWPLFSVILSSNHNLYNDYDY